MIKVYAVVLAVGVLLLITWILMTVLAGNLDRPSLDPESRFGIGGRRLVAGSIGFGMAGMSAEYSPLGIAWPLALVLAVAGGGVLAWYSAKVGLETDEAT